MIPLSLYIHIPWCIEKCPYCDFNSHKKPQQLPEEQYIDALLADFRQDFDQLPTRRSLHSIFIGGGTPSLFSARAYARLLNRIQALIPFETDIEITLEANPGTVDQAHFMDYRKLGINRLSLGVQSFNDQHLRGLGRIHDANACVRGIETARHAGFDNINIDLMHGLPKQTIEQGLLDLERALNFSPEHLSWYQLTIEPNTVFHKHRPVLPSDETTSLLEGQGIEMLALSGYQRYEISAYAQHRQSRHNLNYWQFGDYFGIGAGAHSKLTQEDTGQIYRLQKYRMPQDYLHPDKFFQAGRTLVSDVDKTFEFMLNTTRLEEAVPMQWFTDRTGLPLSALMPNLEKAAAKGLLVLTDSHWQVTALGRRYTNDLQIIFLPE